VFSARTDVRKTETGNFARALPENAKLRRSFKTRRPPWIRQKATREHTGQHQRTPKTNSFFFFSLEGVPVSIKQGTKKKKKTVIEIYEGTAYVG
jgi:hypothetical protein